MVASQSLMRRGSPIVRDATSGKAANRHSVEEAT
ncbi:hypothetical protein DYST_02676 [Dyella terrae]|nr:hypothetical protein DYST_02676 [Dyella terrae]